MFKLNFSKPNPKAIRSFFLVVICVLFGFLVVVKMTDASSNTDTNNIKAQLKSAVAPRPAPTVTMIEFDKSIREIKELKSDLDKQETKLEQQVKQEQLEKNLEKAVKDLKDLKEADEDNKLLPEAKQKIAESQQVISIAANQRELTIEETAELEQSLLVLDAEAFMVACTNEGEVTVKVFAIEGTNESSQTYEVWYANAVDSVSAGEKFGDYKGKDTPAQRNDISPGIYYFWTLEPGNPTRKGEKKPYKKLCNSPVPDVKIPTPR